MTIWKSPYPLILRIPLPKNLVCINRTNLFWHPSQVWSMTYGTANKYANDLLNRQQITRRYQRKLTTLYFIPDYMHLWVMLCLQFVTFVTMIHLIVTFVTIGTPYCNYCTPFCNYSTPCNFGTPRNNCSLSHTHTFVLTHSNYCRQNAFSLCFVTLRVYS